MRELASTLDFVRVLDLERTVGARIDDATLRPDGSHFEYEVDTGIADAVSHAIVDLTHDVATGAGH